MPLSLSGTNVLEAAESINIGAGVLIERTVGKEGTPCWLVITKVHGFPNNIVSSQIPSLNDALILAANLASVNARTDEDVRKIWAQQQRDTKYFMRTGG